VPKPLAFRFQQKRRQSTLANSSTSRHKGLEDESAEESPWRSISRSRFSPAQQHLAPAFWFAQSSHEGGHLVPTFSRIGQVPTARARGAVFPEVLVVEWFERPIVLTCATAVGRARAIRPAFQVRPIRTRPEDEILHGRISLWRKRSFASRISPSRFQRKLPIMLRRPSAGSSPRVLRRSE